MFLCRLYNCCKALKQAFNQNCGNLKLKHCGKDGIEKGVLQVSLLQPLPARGTNVISAKWDAH